MLNNIRKEQDGANIPGNDPNSANILNSTNSNNSLQSATNPTSTVPANNGAANINNNAILDPDNNEDEENESRLIDLLYHPFDLHTPQRKVTQINILQWIIYERKKEFNKEILSVLELKKMEIAKMEERNERINEIANELNEKVEMFHPGFDDDEVFHYFGKFFSLSVIIQLAF